MSEFKRPFQHLLLASVVFGVPLLAQHSNPPNQVRPASPVPAAGSSQTVSAASGAPPPLSFSSWTPIGPASLNGGILYSGRIAGVAADPGVATTLYIAAAGGGVWKTTDGGTSWTPITDALQTLAMGAIAVAPSNGNVIYAGTGEANNSADSQYGYGILTSTDGGLTWTLRTGPSNILSTSHLTTSKIAVDPTNASVAYAAMGNIGNNAAFTPGTGVYKTTDGGGTWVNMTAANGKDSSNTWSDVAVDPNTPSTIYAAIGEFYNNTSSGVYKSTDSGSTWTKLTSFPDGATNSDVGRISIAIAASNSQVVYVSAARVSTGAVLSVTRSDNGGASVTNVTPVNYMGGQGWYDQAILVDPANSAIVYVSGSAGANEILKSINSGSTWTDISSGGASPHADHHALAFDAAGHVLDGDDGGIFRLDSQSPITWTDLNANIATIQFQGVAAHPSDASIAVGGSQDNGTEQMTSGNPVWTETDGGDGGLVRFNQQTPTNLLRVSPVGSFGSAFFRKSTTTGASWTTAVTGLNSGDNMNFYPPFTIDPTNGNHALFGSFKIYETTNFASSWAAIGSMGLSTDPIDAVAIAPSDPANTFYIAQGGYFASSSSIFVTTNHGATWTSRNLPAGNGRVADFAIDPVNSSLAYAVVSTFDANGHVFKTTNAGVTWSPIGTVAAGLPDLPAWAIRRDPVTKNLFVGNDIGVYYSTNEGASWTRFGTSLPNAQVLDLDLNSGLGILTAGTHGRSAWQIKLPPPATNVTAQFTISNFAPSFNRATQKWSQTVKITNTGGALSDVAYVLDSLNTGWTVSNADGTTIATTPAGSPYKIVGAVGAGQTVTLSIQFLRTGTPVFGYTPRILDGTSR